MNAAMTDALACLRAVGIHLDADDGRLAYRAPAGTMTPDIKAWLTAHKAQLIELLQPVPRAPASRADCGAPPLLGWPPHLRIDEVEWDRCRQRWVGRRSGQKR